MSGSAGKKVGLAAVVVIALGVAPAAWAQGGPGRPVVDVAPLIAEAEAKPTPRKGAHVDLTGSWGAPGRGPGNGGFRPPEASGGSPSNVIQVFSGASSVAAVNANDLRSTASRRANAALRPTYVKAEDAQKALKNFDDGSQFDPTYGCKLPGIARLGLPTQIYQSENSIVLLYDGLFQTYRVVPLDGRTYDLSKVDPVPLGYSSGRWDGDTLVIESVGFPEDHWLDLDGSFHSDKLKVTERITRKGDALHYVVVNEDPIFAKPFTSADRRLVLGKSDAVISSPYQCVEVAQEYLVNGAKH